jgi:DNA-binding response OmpR family regulator/signal transduction histidine kinase
MNPSRAWREGDCPHPLANSGLWIEENAISLSQPSAHTSDNVKVPAGFTQEYQVLAEMCASMSSGFMLLNGREQITYSNPSALRLLRLHTYDEEGLQHFELRQHLLSLAANTQQVRAELDQFWLQPEQEYYTDLALAGAAASWLRVRFFPVRHEDGRLLGRGVLLEDITLERSAAESRAETLALAAHELKTPLAIIKGCATTLLGGSMRWDQAMQREMLQMIDTQSDRLYDVLNTLLDVWRFDAGTQPLRLAQIQLSELVLQLIKRWQKQAPDHQFILDLPPGLPLVICDALRIEQVLNHLLNNAITYSPTGKVIRIQLEANETEMRVSVADEGIGLEAEHLERVFQRFYRVQDEQTRSGQAQPYGASPQATGSGLGLAAARATIEAHGGKIWADSAGLGEGATFSFTLPFAPSTLKSATTPLALPEQVSTTPLHTTQAGVAPCADPVQTCGARHTGYSAISQHSPYKQDQRIRVLLAENDARLARYIRANLEEQQYRVQVVKHGVQFLRQMDLEEPDVIIMAERLADMRGIELLQRLREFSNVPVIALCDDCTEDERVQLLDLGSDDLVIKPFGMKELLARVRALLRRQIPATEHTQNRSVFVTGELIIDYAQHLVTVQNKPVQLSRTEYKLLSTLSQNVGMVVTHELLLEKVWGPEYNRDIDFIWVYISRLRRKIESDSRHPKYILTVPDVGYKLAKI